MRKWLFAALAFAGASTAHAHSWYPWECCSDQDCYPVTVKDVRATPQGWYLEHERITIPYQNARPSPDGQFHICRNELGKGTLITPQGKPPCLWVPMGAS